MMTEEEIRQFLSRLHRDTPTVKKVQFPELRESVQPGVRIGLDYLEDVEVEVAAELGQVEMTLREFLKLTKGSIIKLDRAAGETIEVMLNGVKFSRGEVLVINDVFALRMHAIASPRTLNLEGES